MPDLLLELFSEEIPARMQAQAAKDLERLVVGALSDRGLLFEGAKAFAGPRRLTLAIAGLPAKQPDVSEELPPPTAALATAAPSPNGSATTLPGANTHLNGSGDHALLGKSSRPSKKDTP